MVRNFDVSLSHYQKIERGDLVRLSTANKLADCFGVTVAELMRRVTAGPLHSDGAHSMWTDSGLTRPCPTFGRHYASPAPPPIPFVLDREVTTRDTLV